MILNGRDDRVIKADLFEYRSPDKGMDLGLFELGGGQFARFVQNVVWDGQFTDVVKQGSGAQGVDLIFGKPHDLADADGVNLRAPDMPEADLIAGVDSGCEGLDGRKMHAAEFRDLFGLLLEALNVNSVSDDA